jgi:UDP-2-acetamido-2,6-beta-L-arabino-hexul-4-ose reductase
MKSVLLMGAQGFIGRNLGLALRRVPRIEVISVDIDTPESVMKRGLDTSDVVFHLAGVNRPSKPEDYETGNVGSLADVLVGLEARQRRPLIVLSSSTQALLDNPYGRSKRRAEVLLNEYATRTGTPIRIFRLPGVFGKWCRPNYNSVVATFCHNIWRAIPIQVLHPSKELELVHVDDVVSAFIELMDRDTSSQRFADVTPVFRISLGSLSQILCEFHTNRDRLHLSDLSDPLLTRLFSTFMAYIPANALTFDLEHKIDDRGVLAELAKAGGYGQFFISRTKRDTTRGNHYHDRKIEKFFVLEGDALIYLRDLSTGEIAEQRISGRELKMVDIPPGWTHSIRNVGTSDLIVLFWASEVFDADRPDTHRAEV